MRKLPAVEDARNIMKQGMEWSMLKWLMEKKRVRQLADIARAALDELEMKVKESWPNEHKIAYNLLVEQEDDPAPKRGRKAQKSGPKAGAKASDSRTDPKADPKVLAAVQKVKEADDAAYNAHEDAEDVFAEAERKMSTSMAKEGARMALIAYDKHEEAIRKAEALAQK